MSTIHYIIIQISRSFFPIIHRPPSGGSLIICITTSLFLSVDKHKFQIRPCRWHPPRCAFFLSSLTTLRRPDRWAYYVLNIAVDNICSESYMWKPRKKVIILFLRSNRYLLVNKILKHCNINYIFNYFYSSKILGNCTVFFSINNK